ncbi:MAG: hypothetical protein ABGY41_22865 [Candidatus Poribacteria bacterium]
MREQNKGRPAYPNELSQDQIDHLVAGLRQGNDPATVCYLCGVSPVIYDRWMSQGKTSKWGQYADFYRAMRAAESEAERAAVDAWRAQWDGHWQASRDFLKLRFPERWGGGEAKREPLSIHLYLPEPDDAL